MDQDAKSCLVCGETIKAVALKCRFCNTDLVAYAIAKESEMERPLFKGHPAVVYSIGQVAPLAGALACAAIALAAGLDAAQVLVCLIAVLMLVILYFYLRSRSTSYSITSQRIKLERGLLSKVQESLELFRIDHFELHKPLGMRLLGLGALRLFSSDAELKRFYLYGIPELESLSDTLRECQLRERTRRGLTTFIKA